MIGKRYDLLTRNQYLKDIIDTLTQIGQETKKEIDRITKDLENNSILYCEFCDSFFEISKGCKCGTEPKIEYDGVAKIE